MEGPDDLKRVNFNLPKELFDRFMEYSQKEYKTASALMTNWVAEYVREKAKEQEDAERKALSTIIRRWSEVIFVCTKSEQDFKQLDSLLTELSEHLLEVSKDISKVQSADIQGKLVDLERKLQR